MLEHLQRRIHVFQDPDHRKVAFYVGLRCLQGPLVVQQPAPLLLPAEVRYDQVVLPAVLEVAAPVFLLQASLERRRHVLLVHVVLLAGKVPLGILEGEPET